MSQDIDQSRVSSGSVHSKSVALRFACVGAVVAALCCCLRNAVSFGDDPKPAKGFFEKLKEKREQNAAQKANKDLLSMEHAGQTRTYRLHLPKTSQGKKPLVVVLHGFGADGGITEILSGFDGVSDKHGFMVAYPDGVGRMWRFWEDLDGKRAPNSMDDVGFITALIDQIIADHNGDARRVYVTGISNGGFMANRLGLAIPNKIAAIAPVAASMPKFMAEQAKNVKPMPIITFHGTDDRIVKTDGTDAFSKLGVSLSASELAVWWAKQNGCQATPQDQRLDDVANDGTRVTRHSYKTTKGTVLVEHYEVEGGGHTWPGGHFQPEFLLGKTSKDINASELMWQFFQKHSR